MVESVTVLAVAPLRITAKPRRPIISASVATIGWTRAERDQAAADQARTPRRPTSAMTRASQTP